MATTLDIVRVPALDDNYVWLLHDAVANETVVVDPSEAAPVLAAANARGWTISQIWNTHWHPDHTNGNAEIKALGATVSGPAAEADKIPTLDYGLRADACSKGARRKCTPICSASPFCRPRRSCSARTNIPSRTAAMPPLPSPTMRRSPNA
jgi:glyoxylase-like metal-dependent hydrolase (beta-lactamase superfamily II)